MNPPMTDICHFTLKGPYCDGGMDVIQATQKIFYLTLREPTLLVAWRHVLLWA